MSKPVLMIGNKCYSSWSLRPWLALRAFDVPFEERQLWFASPDFAREVAAVSPTRRVPVLLDGPVAVWDSLAICEYIDERFLDRRGWPADRAARAMARAVCAEMHSGFAALRGAMPMDCRAAGATLAVSEAARRDVVRMRALLAGCRERHGAGGPWLFGAFSLADCYFAPVVVRFKGYGVALEGAAAAWAEALWALPALAEWVAAGRAEREEFPEDVLAPP